ncbi:PHP domain-containing protein [Catenovulum sediminis]|uniref:PHP domain-containing protein n=1 Tax=Catenovulum sediminis TaxID=1740262 RepID=A0ABV1RKV6_9ALTE|nr:PHP domain-containing protein [Catenovulum sediminis]
MKIDLHSHTNCSDGELTPKELVLRAANKGVSVLAITDHDTVAAINPAQNAIEAFNLPLQLIHGVEISTRWHGFEIHVVGLNIDIDNVNLVAALERQQNEREARAFRIASKLARVIPELDAEVLFDTVKKMAGGESISRVHFARHLLNNGYVTRIQQAFDKYLGRKGKAYTTPDWMSLEDAVALIQSVGGQAVLAHPTRYDLKNKWIKKLVDDFALAKGDAIEVALPRQNNNELIQLANYAHGASLKASQGSDFHRVSSYTELGDLLPLPQSCQPIWATWNLKIA